MNTSLIITCGYIKHSDPERARLETERTLALQACLHNLASFDFSQGDEIIVVEYGEKSALEGLIRASLSSKAVFKYVFVYGKGFNQSIAKNAGAKAAKNEILCWINSDVLVQKNLFEVLRQRFEKNPQIFATAARHDVFLNRSALFEFFDKIHDERNYTLFETNLLDAGWNFALGLPQQPIPTVIKALAIPRTDNWHIIHDFTQGYINYGELMAVSKDVWNKYPFDEEITAIVDSFYRDIIFCNEAVFGLELIHDQVAIFHLSGSDYMQQTQTGSDKYKRLIADMITAVNKYECLRHWLVLGYFKEFDELIAKYQVPFKEIFEQYKTPLMDKFFRDKEHVNKLYDVYFSKE